MNVSGQPLSFSWVDEDGDVIKFSSNNELQEAVDFYKKKSQDVLKFDISTAKIRNPNKIAGDKPVHTHVTCDECGLSPIVGVRYKCSVREDYDLCETCESQNTQPYPMIKIYSQEQAPLAILIAVGDDVRGRPHMGRHPHPVGGSPGAAHHGPGNWGRKFGGPGPRPFPGGQGGRCLFDERKGFQGYNSTSCLPNRMGKWARCAAKSFVDAMDAAAPVAVASTINQSQESLSSEAAEIEQKIIDEAIRLSVEESSQTSISEKQKTRFVQDVTFPDGTCVQPGTHFLKVWRVRNDGVSQWNEGNVLVAAGGDLLSAPDAKVMLPVVQAGQETDIAIQLVAPDRTGRHVAYFRLQTSDGTNFGQRLWADVRVAEDVARTLDWQVVSDVQANVQDTQPSNGAFSRTESMSVASTVSSMSQLSVGSADDTNTGSGTSATIPAVVAVRVGSTSAPPSAPSVATIFATNNQEPLKPAGDIPATNMANTIWLRVYETELKVLRDMGFTDVSAIVPLLREHVGMPVSRNPELRGQPSAEAMQRVVVQLLGQSMTL